MSEAENTIHKSDSGDHSEFDVCFRYYEKAIEGRNFHYQNYNTWVNYYAIFTGALFVGYYTIIDKCNGPFSCLIVVLGCITSIAWHLTVKGHYHWMLSWIEIVQSYEAELAKIQKNNKSTQWYVYSVHLPLDSAKDQKNISSQKLTSRFTLIVCIAWFVLLIFEFVNGVVFGRCASVLWFQNVCIKIGMFVVGVLGTVISRFILDKPSDVSKMKKSIFEKQESCNND